MTGKSRQYRPRQGWLAPPVPALNPPGDRKSPLVTAGKKLQFADI